MAEDLGYTTLLTMAIEQGKQLERVLQITENLEERQDDMKQGMDYLLKTVNGNGDGRGGLKTAAVVHDQELSQVKKELEEIKHQRTADAETMNAARQFFSDRKNFQFGWKQFLFVGLLQTVITSGVLALVIKLIPQLYK